jgi:5'-3' exonuclease
MNFAFYSSYKEELIFFTTDQDLYSVYSFFPDKNVKFLRRKSKKEKRLAFGSNFEELDIKDIAVSLKMKDLSKWLIYRSFVGDTSDNIKGVKGIGEATASCLMFYWDTNKSISNNIEFLKDNIDNFEKIPSRSKTFFKKNFDNSDDIKNNISLLERNIKLFKPIIIDKGELFRSYLTKEKSFKREDLIQSLQSKKFMSLLGSV